MTERTIFLAALELTDASERAAYVERACGDDAALRAQVEALLTTHEQSGGFLETPAVPPMESEVIPTLVGTDSPPDPKPGKERVSAESQLRRYLQPTTRPGWLGRLGHYEIEAILGRGAFGVVAKAFDDKLHRVVAIKMLHPELAATSPPRQRFLREARTAAAVQHENIVGIFAVEEEPLPYLVMEYIPGESLQQRLDRIGPLHVPEVLRIGRQLAAGLAAAHAAHLIHRDIKPSNILLAGGLDDRVKVSDFGLARAVDDASLTQSGVIAGTPMYMAPEQARGETLDHRADLFSLGSVLYQMVSGRPPFRAGNTIAVLKRVCDDAPRPITDVIPGTPEWLQAIIFRLLEKDRNNRFQTATEVANRLEQCQTELRVKGFVESVPELDPKFQETTVAPALPATNTPGVTKRGEFRSSLLRWLLLPLAVLAAMPFVGQRLARWFDTPIPQLPQTEQVAGLRFDGRDDYVAVTGLDWDYPQFTIEALVTSSNASGQGTIVQLSGGTANKIEFMALYDGAQADPGKRTSGARIQGKSPYVNAYGPFAGEVRQHRALSFDGRYLNYYINGVWQGQRFAEPHEGLQWRMTSLHIGCDGEQRSRFQGVIEQVRISRVARYTQNFSPITSLSSDDKTLAMYDFREGRGETLRDVSGNGHDGKIVGAEWVRGSTELIPSAPENPPRSATPEPVPVLTRSPWDDLDPARIPAAERVPNQPDGLVAVIGQHRQRVWKPIHSVAVSSDGRQFLSTTEDGISVFDQDERHTPAIFPMNIGENPATFIPDGRVATFVGVRGKPTVQLQIFAQPQQGTPLILNSTIVTDEPAIFHCLTASSDGRWLAAWESTSGRFALWKLDGKQPEQVARFPMRGGCTFRPTISFSPDGNWFCFTYHSQVEDTVHLVNLRAETPGEVHVLKADGDEKSDVPAKGFSTSIFLADGRLATADRNGRIWFWKLDQGAPQRVGNIRDLGDILESHPGCSRLVVMGGAIFRVWDLSVEPPRLIGTSTSSFPADNILFGALAPDGKTVMTGHLNRSIRFWNVSPTEITETDPLAPNPRLSGDDLSIETVALAEYLCSSTEHDRGEFWRATPAGLQSVTGNPPAHWILGKNANQGVVIVRESGASGGTLLLRREGDQWKPVRRIDGVGLPRCAALSDDGHRLAIGRHNGTEEVIELWGWESGEQPAKKLAELKAPRREHGCVQLAFTDEDRTLVGRLSIHAVELWDVRDDQLVRRAQLPSRQFGRFAVSPDGRTLATTVDSGLELWDLSSDLRQPTASFPLRVTGAVAFSPDGRHVAASFRENGSSAGVKFLNLASGIFEKSLTFPGVVNDLDYTDEGRHLVSGNANGTIYVVRLAGVAKVASASPKPPQTWHNWPADAHKPAPVLTRSPWDDLDPARIPAAERVPNQPRELVAVLGEHRQRHWSQVSGVSMRPDGLQAATCDEHGIRFWDLRTYREQAQVNALNTPDLPPGGIVSLLYVPDGRSLLVGHAVSGPQASYISELDISVLPPKVKRSWKLPSHLASNTMLSELSPTGRYVSTLGRIGSRCFVAERTETELRPISDFADGWRASFAPDEKSVAVSTRDGGPVRLMQFQDAKLVETGTIAGSPTEVADQPLAPLRDARFAPDGRLLVVDAKLVPWFLDLSAEQPHPAEKLAQTAWFPTFARDGSILVATGDVNGGGFSAWNIDGRNTSLRGSLRVERFPRNWVDLPNPNIMGSDISADGKLAVLGHLNGSVKFLDIATADWAERHPVQPNPVVANNFTNSRPLRLGERGFAVMSEERDHIRTWHLDQGRWEHATVLDEGHGHPLSTSADGEWLVTHEGPAPHVAIHRREGKGWRIVRNIPSTVDALCGVLSRDQRRLLIGGNSGVVELWDIESKPARKLWTQHTPENQAVLRLQLTRNEEWLVTQAYHTVLIQKLTNTGLEDVLRIPGGQFNCLDIDDTGRSMALAWDNSVSTWSLETNPPERVQSLSASQTSAPRSVAYSPDGTQLAVSHADGQIRLHDLESGTITRRLQCPGSVNQLMFAPDGRHLLTANGNGTMYVLRLATAPKTETTSASPKPPQTWHNWPADAPKPAIAPFDAAQAKKHQEEWAAYLKVPVEYTNSIGMKFRLIPPGEFLMGSTAEEIAAALKDADPNQKHWQECIKSEAPQHKVILTQPIYLGVNEVTQAEYEKVMGVNPSHFAPRGMGKEVVAGLETAEHPVEMVSWNDAAEFCAKASQLEKLKPFYFRAGQSITPLDGTGYRLPSEAEWEFACRAGTTTRYWMGDKDQDLVRAGWFAGNCGGRTHSVGELKANPFGLFDVHGNVWEWVQDGWDQTFYGRFQGKPAIDPNSPFSDRSPSVVRGGRWFVNSSSCRSSTREAYGPADRGHDFGFRVSLPVETVRQALKSQYTPSEVSTSRWHNWPADAPKPAIAPFDAAQAKRHQEEWATFLKVPVEYTSSIGMKFRLIPPGEFLMGAPETDADAQPYEKPQHSVTLTQAYYMGATEVTVGQFRRFVEATKYVTEAESDGKGAFGVNPAVRHPDNVWNGKSIRFNADDFPVRCVSWQDAIRYCEWLSQTEDRTARLPTEAEWEYACRAGTRTRYSFGNGVADTPNPPRGKGAPFSAVAKGPANPFGLHEMHGNVHEICWDAGRTYTTAAVTDPIGSLEPGSLPAIRGGAVSGDVSRMRSSHRYLKDGRSLPVLNFATPGKGFRVVLVGPLTSSATATESPRQPVDRSEPRHEPAKQVRSEAPQPAIAPFDAAQAKRHQEEWAKYLKVPVEYTNSIGMKFRLIPPGEFTMGSTAEEVEAAQKQLSPDHLLWREIVQSETPKRRVVLTRPIYVSVQETTQSEYQKVMGANPSKFCAQGADAKHVELVKGIDTSGHPVENVSWNEAVAFCDILSDSEKIERHSLTLRAGSTVSTGGGYRLPTEAEWEFFCRGGTTTKYWFGDDDDGFAKVGWWGQNSGGRTHAVGELRGNPFGLFDVHGNVWEWVLDGWDKPAKIDSPATANVIVDPIAASFEGSLRIHRGGNFFYPAHCRSAARNAYEPTARLESLGFRVTLSVDAVRNQHPREIVRWVLGTGGGVDVVADGQLLRLPPGSKADGLPKGEFSIVAIALRGGSPISDDDLTRLANLPDLDRFIIDSVPVTDRGIANLGVFPKLQAIHFTGMRTTERSLESIGRWTGLRDITIGDFPCSDGGLVPLENLQRLESLRTGHLTMSDAQTRSLSKLPKLKFLWLMGEQLDDDTLRNVARLPALTAFTVTFAAQSGITNEGAKALAANPRIVSVNLDSTQVDNQGLAFLAERKNWEEFLLDGTRITDAGLPKLRELPKLRTLWLSRTAISDAGLETLGQCAALEVLYLKETGITDAGLAHLEPLKKLRELHLDRTRVTLAGVERLRKRWPNCKITAEELVTDAAGQPE